MTRVATPECAITAANSRIQHAGQGRRREDGITAPNRKQGTSTRGAGGLQSRNAKTGLEYADPKDPIARMRGYIAEVARLFGDDDERVNEVQA